MRKEPPGAGHWSLTFHLLCSISGRKVKSLDRKISSCTLYSKHSFTFLAVISSCLAAVLQTWCVAIQHQDLQSIPSHTRESVCHASCSKQHHEPCWHSYPSTQQIFWLDWGRQGKVTHATALRLVVPKWQCFLKICQTLAFFFFANWKGAQLMFWHKCLGSKAWSKTHSFNSFLLSYFAKWSAELKGAFPWSTNSIWLPFPTSNCSVILLTWS